MGTLQVSRLTVGAPTGKLQVSRLLVGGTAAPVVGKLQVASVSVAGAALPATGRLQVSQIRVSGDAQNAAPLVSVNKTSLTVDSGDRIVLIGSDSDADGTVVARKWTRSGTTLTANGVLDVVAPVVTADTTLTFTYTATDDFGAFASASVPVLVLRAPVIVRLSDGTLVGRVYRKFTAAEVAAANP